ncbi:MAG TPA: hypothetical protein VJO12_16815 [Stellaceae bacterium]|nr:hypothetical protein [Stellaceae bacterium]
MRADGCRAAIRRRWKNLARENRPTGCSTVLPLGTGEGLAMGRESAKKAWEP